MKPSSKSIVFFFFTVTIKIEPTNYEIIFKPLKQNRKGCARAAQYIPSLFTTIPEKHSESMPIEIIDAALNFHRELNATLPNVKDTAKRHVGHKQWETAQVIYFHESWDELRATFHINHTKFLEKLAKKK